MLDVALQLVIVYTAHMWLTHTWCVQDSSIGGVCVPVQLPGGLSLHWLTWQEYRQRRGRRTSCAESVLPGFSPMAVLHSVLLSEQWSG